MPRRTFFIQAIRFNRVHIFVYQRRFFDSLVCLLHFFHHFHIAKNANALEVVEKQNEADIHSTG